MSWDSLGLSAERLQAAFAKAHQTLLAERVEAGHWVGELSTSALSTATAVSALALIARARAATATTTAMPATPATRLAEVPSSAPGSDGTDAGCSLEDATITGLIRGGIRWLAQHQNADGGWGDTQVSYSNISTTLLAQSAFHLAGEAEGHAAILRRAEEYVAAAGGIPALRKRYGRDKTFAVPILTNCALAGLVPWREVSPLPFELACFPQGMYRLLQLPVVSYAIPALVAIGQARYFHRPPLNPVTRWIRSRAVPKSLRVLERMQPASGGYLEAVPLTSFVMMSLAATGRADHPVTLRGLKFLIDSVRPDGSWPIDTNLATWNTTLSLNALAAGGSDISAHRCLDWLLGCQMKQVHPFTGADPGGWGWTDLSGSVPDADDTPSALLALATWSRSAGCSRRDRRRIRDAAAGGVRWLLGLQNRNGGWPTFCRGWGKLPFDRSGADLTAHAIRALHAWSDLCDARREIQRGLKYLARVQRPDGSWTPLWFGNQDHPRDENPVYGTAKVLLAYRDLEMLETPVAERGLAWLQAAQNADGGWGGGPAVGTAIGSGTGEPVSSIEETAVAIEALLAWPALQRWSVAAAGEPPHPAVMGLVKGLDWLVTAVEQDRFRHPSPIGFYFAKLWYHEKLYPIIFTASALGRAIRGWAGTADSGGSTSHLVSVAAETPPFSDRTEAKRKLAPHGKDVPVSGVRGIQQPCP